VVFVAASAFRFVIVALIVVKVKWVYSSFRKSMPQLLDEITQC